MTSALLAAAAALAIGLPVFALGERLRGRRERSLSNQCTSPSQKDTP